jgi:hypothetical protein
MPLGEFQKALRMGEGLSLTTNRELKVVIR